MGSINDKVSMKENVVVVLEKNGVKKAVGEKSQGKSFRDRLPGWMRNLYDPNLEQIFHRIGVVVVLTNEMTRQKRVIEGPPNLVTTQGDKYYAEMACAQAPTYVFASMSLCTAGPTPVVKASAWNDFTVHAGGVKVHTATYPLCPDIDADNTGLGAAVISWKFEFAAGDGPFVAIQWCFIAAAGAAAGAPILQGYKWGAAWDKDAATSAKIFVNHTLLGA
jgi:hypothetical protein